MKDLRKSVIEIYVLGRRNGMGVTSIARSFDNKLIDQIRKSIAAPLDYSAKPGRLPSLIVVSNARFRIISHIKSVANENDIYKH